MVEVNISGPLLSMLMKESFSNGRQSFGVLVGDHSFRTSVRLSDASENTTSVCRIGVSSYVCTQQHRPFYHHGKIKANNTCFSGVTDISKNGILSPSFRDIETLCALRQAKHRNQPIILLQLCTPESSCSPSWIYGVQYSCVALEQGTGRILTPVTLHIPSLAPDMASEYSAVESILSSVNPLSRVHDLDCKGGRNVGLSIPSSTSAALAVDSILSRVRTEAAVVSLLCDIQGELRRLATLTEEVSILRSHPTRS